jgi:hypothetical protein
MHDNGRYVKSENSGFAGRSTPQPPLPDQKIRRAGFRFVHRFR